MNPPQSEPDPVAAHERDFPLAEGGVPVSDRLAEEVLSLPMHAYLEPPVQDRIIESVRRALAN